MGRWKIEVYDQDGNAIADLSGKSLKRRFSKVRNRAPVIDLSYDLDEMKAFCQKLNTTAPELFAINQNEIRVTRDTSVYMAGQIVYRQPVITDDERTINIKAVGWFDLLGVREIDEAVRFDQIEQGQIAWSLIDTAQQREDGDFGITQGYIQAGPLRDRSYESRKNIKEAIVQLSEVIGGFDMEVTWDKKFNVYYPKMGSRKPDIVLTYPGSIRTISFASDGMKMANEIIARGSGTGEDAFKATSSDEVSRQKYKLRQATVDYSDVSLVDTLQEHGDDELNFRSKFLDVPDVTLDSATAPAFGSYDLGDEIRIEVTEDLEIFGTVNDFFRIDAIDVELDENDDEDIRLRMMR